MTDSLDIGGGERHVVDLTIELKRRGYEVHVACSVGGSLAATLDGAGVPVRALLSRLAKRRVSLPFAWKLRRLVASGRYDLVPSHMYASAVASALVTLVHCYS